MHIDYSVTVSLQEEKKRKNLLLNKKKFLILNEDIVMLLKERKRREDRFEQSEFFRTLVECKLYSKRRKVVPFFTNLK